MFKGLVLIYRQFWLKLVNPFGPLRASYTLKAKFYTLKGSLFKYGEERSIVCDCTHEEKMNCEGFTQNGFYGNQPHPFECFIALTPTLPVL